MSIDLKDCCKKIITPASSSVIVGATTAFILFVTSASQGDETTVAAQYIAALAALAKENAIAALSIAGGITTAMFYTFIAKPAATCYANCCKKETGDASADGVFAQSPYSRV